MGRAEDSNMKQFKFSKEVVNAGKPYKRGDIAELSDEHAEKLQRLGFGEVVEPKRK